MGDEKFILPGPETVSMSGDAAKKLMACGSGDAALLYLCILSGGGMFSRETAAARIRRTPEQVDAAMDVLARLGLVRRDEAPAPEPADELPAYTAEDIRRELDSGAAFRQLVAEVQSSLGKKLSSEELVKLFGIYDHLGLPAEVVLCLVNHCIMTCTARYGAGRRPTMRYIEKAAYEWEREGVFSLDAAEAYLKRREALDAATASFADALQIRGRALTVSERRYIADWIAMGFTAEAAGEAYDRTVLKTGRLTWRYMDSIMKSWHAKGLHTPAEIRRGDGRRAPARKPEAKNGPAVTAEDIERSRRALEKIKEEG